MVLKRALYITFISKALRCGTCQRGITHTFDSEAERATPAFSSPAAQPHLTLAGIPVFHPVEGRVLSWPGWLTRVHTKTVYSRTVTHPSTNRARRRATSLMWPTTLPPGQTTTVDTHCYIGRNGKRCMHSVATDTRMTYSNRLITV